MLLRGGTNHFPIVSVIQNARVTLFMKNHSIDLIQPTTRAWAGMKRVLFQPFDIGKWFVLGFTAWLAHLLETSGGGGQAQGSGGNQESGRSFEQTMEWARANIELVIGVAALLFAIALAVVITLLWVRSRGKLMFLDNVVHNRALVKTPWSQFRRLGNSLFKWNLVFGAIVMFVIALLAGGLGAFIYYQSADWSVPSILVVVAFSLMMFILILLMSYITLLLEDFVVPLMYQHSLTTNDAWRKFLVVHRQALGWFVLYALWKFLLGMAAVLAVMAIGFATCCVGFIPLMIPYLGAVLMLPVSVFFRFLGPEFLRQFGGEYDIFCGLNEQDSSVCRL
jgi:hypothetical protein